MSDLQRGKASYDEALRRALAIRETMAEHRRGKPMAFPASPPRPESPSEGPSSSGGER